MKIKTIKIASERKSKDCCNDTIIIFNRFENRPINISNLINLRGVKSTLNIVGSNTLSIYDASIRISIMFLVSLQNLVRPAVNLRRISKENRDKITNMNNKIYWNNGMFHG